MITTPRLTFQRTCSLSMVYIWDTTDQQVSLSAAAKVAITGGMNLSLNDVSKLQEALDKLGEKDPRERDVAQLCIFTTMSQQEIAKALNISLSTVKRDLTKVKFFLLSKLHGNG